VSSAERKGKAPPLERGRGRHSSPANPGRVTVRQAHDLSKVEGRESMGAKGQWCSLVKEISHCKANTLRRCFAEKSGNSSSISVLTFADFPGLMRRYHTKLAQFFHSKNKLERNSSQYTYAVHFACSITHALRSHQFEPGPQTTAIQQAQ
jgi:hypothetical protein